jgi:hypothetical protein
LPGRTLPASLGNGATLVTGQAAVADNGHSFALSPPDPYLLHELLAEGQNNRGTLTLAHGEFHAVMPLDERFADGWGRLESCLAGLPR